MTRFSWSASRWVSIRDHTIQEWPLGEHTGVFVPEGGGFTFQMHYTPSGRATTDVSRMALYFYDEPPTHFLRNHVILNPRIRIPPNTAGHEEHACMGFDADAVIHGLYPHAHFRGRSATFVLRYPDGEEEMLLSVPRYDFNWQREYTLAEPVAVPAGSKLIYRTIYDNTARNRANPDPSREVPWGLQSADEMLYGGVLYRWAHETSDAPTHDLLLAEARQLFGFMDVNMDGTLQWNELPTALQRAVAPLFPEEMRDTDQGMSLEQLRQVLQMSR